MHDSTLSAPGQRAFLLTPAGTRLAAVLALAIVVVLSLLGCGGDEKSYGYTEVRDRPPPPESSGPAWNYATPAGWEELPSGPMRDAAWRAAGNPDAEVTFAALPGGAGGLLANVNRWRGQMGLDPADEAAVAALPKQSFLGRPATQVELSGTFKGMGGTKNLPAAKLLGLVAELPAATVFLKFVGPAAVVDAEAPKFFALAASLKMGPGGAGRPVASEGPGAGMPPGHPKAAPFSWVPPAGWKETPSQSSIRLVTFVPEKAPNVEVAVSIVGGELKPNLDIWAQQMAATPLTDEQVAALPRIKVLGGDAVMVTIEGTWKNKPGSMLLGMVLPRPGQSVFVKMTGPADEVRGERERFQAFCESFHE